MKRRDATTLLTALAGGSLAGVPTLLSGCRETVEHDLFTFFTQEEMILLEQVAETILPPTPNSPGAKAAGIGVFMDRYVADCLDEEAQGILRDGLRLLDQGCREQYSKTFLNLSTEEQQEFLIALDIEAEQQQSPKESAPNYFPILKGLILLGYFTSEVGATQALRYVPVPGRYEGSIPYQDGEKAWAI